MSQKIQINNLDLHYERREGKGNTLLFLHGLSMSSRIWEKQLNAEAIRPYDLICLDLPGHGRSARSSQPQEVYIPSGYVDSLLEFTEALNLNDFFIIGLSIGGNIAIEALPQLMGCRGIVLVGTGIVGKPAAIDRIFQPHPAIFNLYKEEVSQQELDELLSLFFSKNQRIPIWASQDFINTDPLCRSLLGQSIAEGKHQDEVLLLKSANIPVAFITGEEDQLLQLDYLKDTGIFFWEKGPVLIPSAGHMPQWENAEVFNEKLLDFVNPQTEQR